MVRHDLVAQITREIVDRGTKDPDRQLKRLLRHDDDRIAEQAIDTLYEYDSLPEYAAKDLLMLLLDFERHPDLVRAALPLADRLDDTHFDQLLSSVDILDGPDDRRFLVDGLGEAGDPRAREKLETIRRTDPDPGVQRAAARALEKC